MWAVLWILASPSTVAFSRVVNRLWLWYGTKKTCSLPLIYTHLCVCIFFIVVKYTERAVHRCRSFEVYFPGALSTPMRSCSRHHRPISRSFSSSQTRAVATKPPLLPLTQFLVAPFYFLFLCIWRLCVPHVSGITQRFSFCISKWVNTVSFRIVYVLVACVRIPFFLKLNAILLYV